MEWTPTALDGCFILEPQVFKDHRGDFMESYNKQVFHKVSGLDVDFVQDNEVFSTYGVIRGLHYQATPHQQAKLVRCVSGRILDVAVDLREDSPTYLQHVAVELTRENRKQLFVPHGFAHGYSVLSREAVVAYKCDTYRDVASERAVHYASKELNIDWGIPTQDQVLSDKDR